MTRTQIQKMISDSSATIAGMQADSAQIESIGKTLVASLKKGRKLLVAGNGGSAAEAMHMAEELIGRFRTNRRALPAVALSADPTAITCIGNDFGFNDVFSRQIEALGCPGDVLVLFSTSGNSENIISALKAGEKKRMKTVCLLGKDGGALAGKADLEVIIPAKATARIQEAHQVILHVVLEMVEEAFGLR